MHCLLEISPNVERLGEEAFAGTPIFSVAIPEGVKTIANGAFSGCTLLSRVDLPASLRTVEENAFLGCDALTTVIYDGPPKYFTSIYFGRGNETLVGVYLMGK